VHVAQDLQRPLVVPVVQHRLQHVQVPPRRFRDTGADAEASACRRLAEPDLEFRAFCARRGLPASSTPQLERAWDAWQAERYQRGETGQWPSYTDNLFRPR
jgi:hypothetical protein